MAVEDLPRTGFDPLPIGLAAALVLTGQVLRAVSRRRRTQAA